MCVHPTVIRNPYYSPGSPVFHYKRDGVVYEAVKTEYDYRTKNFDDEFISVGCGHCSECIAKRSANYICRCILEAQKSYVYVGMLSYNPEHLPWHEVDGIRFPYADHKHFRDMVKRLRKDEALPPFRYFLVDERGSEGHRPHFHFLLFFDRNGVISSDQLYRQYEPVIHDTFLKYWAVNVGSRKNPIYEPLLTFRQKFQFGRWYRNYDLQCLQVRPGRKLESVYYYVSKYLAKDDPYIRRLKERLSPLPGQPAVPRIYFPHVSKSLHLGEDQEQIIAACFRSLQEGSGVSVKIPLYNKQFPLPPYWLQKYLVDNLVELDFIRHDRIRSMVFQDRPQSAADRDVIISQNRSAALAADVIDMV